MGHFKSSILVVSLLCISIVSYSKSVDPATARTAAANFYTYKTPANITGTYNLSLAYTCSSKSNLATQSTSHSLYYIFNVNTHDGFVIVSSDDAVKPILGYSTTGSYSATNVSPEFAQWMLWYQNQIEQAINHGMQASAATQSKWNELTIPNKNVTRSIQAAGVSPLVQTKWNQAPYYNDDCPYDTVHSVNCVTGCVATTMAQIMKYWNYPAMGTGVHAYNSHYGTLSVNFGNTTYNWANMPDSISTANADIANLMYDCGVSVDMEYTAYSSGAWVISSDSPVCAQNAFVKYFKYNPFTIQGLYRQNFSDSTWIKLLLNELNNGRPVEYAGWGSAGGHTWVCDGYDANQLFHMNWGWGGSYDGYFDTYGLVPDSWVSLNFAQEILIGIEPIHDTASANVRLNSVIKITRDTVPSGQAFTVNTDVYNAGTKNFNGVFYAAIFDTFGRFITYADTFATGNTPLAAGSHYTGGLSFTYKGLPDPGKYYIGMYYKPTGGTWYPVNAYSSYTNPAAMMVVNPTDSIELYSFISATPYMFYQHLPATVSVNLRNISKHIYYGKYCAVLSDVHGHVIDTLATYYETTGLAVDSSYAKPYVVFNADSITAPPGMYNLAIWVYDNASKTWYYAGDNLYANPISIEVMERLQPDIYEPDNTVATAYTLPLAFNNNDITYVSTMGSNIHIPGDVDYYKIKLDWNYDYTISVQLNDSHNSPDGNNYTDRMQYIYLQDGVWSTVYGSKAQASITVNGHDSIIFYVTPFTAGQVGTYTLDINITRQGPTGINNIVESTLLHVFPNPATNMITISKLTNSIINELLIVNALGQVILRTNIDNAASIENIDVSTLANGLYYIEVLTDKQKYISKFVVNR